MSILNELSLRINRLTAELEHSMFLTKQRKEELLQELHSLLKIREQYNASQESSGEVINRSESEEI